MSRIHSKNTKAFRAKELLIPLFVKMAKLTKNEVRNA